MKIPILRLGRILLASIQEDLTDTEAMQFQSDLVNEVAEIEALGAGLPGTRRLVDHFQISSEPGLTRVVIRIRKAR